MARLLETWRMDRTAWSEETLADQGRDRAYWMTRDPAERLAAVELARQLYYGGTYDPNARVERVFRILKLGED